MEAEPPESWREQRERSAASRRESRQFALFVLGVGFHTATLRPQPLHSRPRRPHTQPHTWSSGPSAPARRRLLGTHGAWVLGGNWQTRVLVPRADAPTATADSTELRRPVLRSALLEHEAQDDTGDEEARQRLRDDPHHVLRYRFVGYAAAKMPSSRVAGMLHG